MDTEEPEMLESEITEAEYPEILSVEEEQQFVSVKDRIKNRVNDLEDELIEANSRVDEIRSEASYLADELASANGNASSIEARLS